MATTERKIQTTLALDGDKAFKASMDEAYRSLKVLGSEMKLNTAIFGDNSKSMEGLTQKGEILGKKIAQQKDIIAAYAKAVEDSTAAYGEGDKRTQEYTIKLNNAQAALVKLEGELKQTNDTLKKGAFATKDAAEKAKELSEKWEKAGENLESAGKKMSYISGAITAAAAAVTKFTIDSGKMADELITTANQTGISTQKLQEWGYAAKFIDTEVSTMTGSMAKMIRAMSTASEATEQGAVDTQKLASAQTAQKNAAIAVESAQIKYNAAVKKYGKTSDQAVLAANSMTKAENTLALANTKLNEAMKPTAGKTNDTAEAFKKLGVRVEDSVTGKLRKSEEVFMEAIDALGKIKNETERDAIAMQIFGKSAQELNPLIKAGSDELKRLGQEARDAGVILDDASLNALGAFDDSMQRMTSQVEAAKNSLAVAFAPAVESVVSAITDAAKSFAGFVNGLDEGTKTMILTIGGVVAAIGPLLVGIGKVSVGISSLITLWPQLTAGMAAFIASPIGGALVTIAAAAGDVSIGLALMNAKTNEAKGKINAATESIKPFGEILSGLSPKLADANDLLSRSGKTVGQLDKAIRDSEDAITKILATALEQHRTLRQSELNSITEYNQKIASLQAEKLQLYRDQQLAELRKIQLEETNITLEGAAQRLVNAEEAYKQSNEIAEEAYTAQLAIIENKYRAMNAIGTATYASAQAAAKTYYDTALAENKSYYAQSVSTISDASAQWVEADKAKWGAMAAAVQDYTNAVSYELKTHAGAVLFGYAGTTREASNQVVSTWEEMWGSVNKTAASGALSFAAQTKALGGTVSTETKNTVKTILSIFENLPPTMEDTGKKALLGLIGGLKEQIPGLESAATMSAKDLVGALEGYLEIQSPSRRLYRTGQNTAQGLIDGVNSKSGSAKSSVSGVGTNIVQGLWSGINSFTSWLHSKIASWVDSVVGWIKDLFGIHSPSVKMRDKIGIPMVQGIAEGITQSAKLVSRAMEGIMPDAQTAALTMRVTRRFEDVYASGSSTRTTRMQATAEISDIALEKLAKRLEAGLSGQTFIVQADGREVARYVGKMGFARA